MNLWEILYNVEEIVEKTIYSIYSMLVLKIQKLHHDTVETWLIVNGLGDNKYDAICTIIGLY